MSPGHPERPDRLRAINTHLSNIGLLEDLVCQEAPALDMQQAGRVHQPAYLAGLERQVPDAGLVALDPDTAMGPGSLEAALLATGAVNEAVRRILDGTQQRAFCAVRPPGHHAEHASAMGFCFINSIASGADTALKNADITRVAVLDFDVHHGNGTVDIFKDRPEVLVCSSFQHPFYPYRYTDIERPNIINTPLAAGTDGATFRKEIESSWLPALEAHQPQLILVSAGFDAHRMDPLGELKLDEEDFRWITEFIVDAARRYADGRIVSALEGGYDLDALSRSVEVHLQTLLSG
jgi:acetoin utilization deacetylase AcuC-like enzyme